MARRILVTGGSGLLGTTLKKFMQEAIYTDIDQLDITNPRGLDRFVKKEKPDTIFHAAAFTSPPKIDSNPALALEVNIVGTANMVSVCIKNNIRLVYMCTDYVFRGDKGSYREEDPVYPVNKYAWSKLGGECAVRLHDNSVIIRTSFGPDEFPYEKAFSDQWTSRQNVSIIAKKIVKITKSDFVGVIHIGGQRRTVYEYAISLSPDKQIGRLSVTEVNFLAPKDTSLDTTKYLKLFGEESEE